VGAVDGGGALGVSVFPEEQPVIPINPAAITTAHKRSRDSSGLVLRQVLMCNIISVMFPDNKHRGRHGWGLWRRGTRYLHPKPVRSPITGRIVLDVVPLLTRSTSADGTPGWPSSLDSGGQTIGWIA